jgi:hypothetical protein
VKVIDSTEPYPLPGRALRNLVARCLTVLYQRGETRRLFDTLQKFMAIAAEMKPQDKVENRMWAHLVVGSVLDTNAVQCCLFLCRRAYGRFRGTGKAGRTAPSPSHAGLTQYEVHVFHVGDFHCVSENIQGFRRSLFHSFLLAWVSTSISIVAPLSSLPRLGIPPEISENCKQSSYRRVSERHH